MNKNLFFSTTLVVLTALVLNLYFSNRDLILKNAELVKNVEMLKKDFKEIKTLGVDIKAGLEGGNVIGDSLLLLLGMIGLRLPKNFNENFEIKSQPLAMIKEKDDDFTCPESQIVEKIIYKELAKKNQKKEEAYLVDYQLERLEDFNNKKLEDKIRPIQLRLKNINSLKFNGNIISNPLGHRFLKDRKTKLLIDYTIILKEQQETDELELLKEVSNDSIDVNIKKKSSKEELYGLLFLGNSRNSLYYNFYKNFYLEFISYGDKVIGKRILMLKDGIFFNVGQFKKSN